MIQAPQKSVIAPDRVNLGTVKLVLEVQGAP